MKVLPVTIAIDAWRIGISIGKLNGPQPTTTPIGYLTSLISIPPATLGLIMDG